MGLQDVPRCQHVKTNGTQCGSPALRRRKYCFFHDKIRTERAKITAKNSLCRFDLPLLEDANAVQMALMKVIQMLGSGTLDPKTAGLMLYALQTASVNLRYTDFEAEEATDVVIDRDTVDATCINGPQWFEEDFEDEAEEDLEDEAAGVQAPAVEAPAVEAKDKGSVGCVQASAEPQPKPAAKKEVKNVTTDEVRKQVQNLARHWVSERLAQKPQ